MITNKISIIIRDEAFKTFKSGYIWFMQNCRAIFTPYYCFSRIVQWHTLTIMFILENKICFDLISRPCLEKCVNLKTFIY